MEYKGYNSVLSIRRDHVKIDDIICVVRNLMILEPKRFNSSLKNFCRLGKNNFWEQLRINLTQEDYFSCEVYGGEISAEREYLNIYYYPTTKLVFIKSIVRTNNIGCFERFENIISDFAQEYHIVAASLRTSEEYEWNDSWDIELHRKNHQELKEIRTIKSHHDETIDFEQFSGHTHEIEGLWFGCTYKMWFGKDYDEYIPLQQIADFCDCESNICYENGTRYITMFKSPYDFSDPSCMQKAFKFREVTDCDAAYEHWKKIVTSIDYVQGQVNMEIEKGTFPHGGIRLFKVYLDENNKPVLKAKAVKVNITERGTDGSVHNEETSDL